MLGINNETVIELCHVFYDVCEFCVWWKGIPSRIKSAKRKVDNIGQYFEYKGNKYYISNFDMERVFA